MASLRFMPLVTFSLIFTVCKAYTELPQAPATQSSDSTMGTPAWSMVDSVRVQRAVHDACSSDPRIGKRNKNPSTAAWKLPWLRQNQTLA